MYTSNDSLIHHVLHHLKEPWGTAVAFERAVFRSGLEVDFEDDFYPVFGLREAVFNETVNPERNTYKEIMDEFSSECVLKLDDFLTSYREPLHAMGGVVFTRRTLMESLLEATLKNYGNRHYTAVYFTKLLETDYLDKDQIDLPAIRV